LEISNQAELSVNFRLVEIPVNVQDRTSIMARVYGHSLDVVILHPGLGRDAAHYDLLARTLAAASGCQIVAYDPRGHYLDPRTGEPENVYSFDGMLSDLSLVVDYFKQGNQVKVIGFSNGALVSAFAANNPSVDALCLVSCPVSLSDSIAYARMCRLFAGLSHAQMKHKFDKYFGRFCRHDSYIRHHRGNLSSALKIGKLYVKCFADHVRNVMSAPTLSELPPAISTPTTFIFAKHDFVLKHKFSKIPQLYQQVFQRFENLQLTVLAKATHGFGLAKKQKLSAQSQKLADELIAFINNAQTTL